RGRGGGRVRHGVSLCRGARPHARCAPTARSTSPRRTRQSAPGRRAAERAVGVETWGRFFRFYQLWDPFDEVIHLAMMGCLASLAYLLLARVELVPHLRDLHGKFQRAALPLLASVLGLALGALWEVYEWFVATYLDMPVITN